MLLWLLDHLARTWPSVVWCGELASLEKITFRASLAALASFVLALVLGPRLIAWLRVRFQEPIKSDSPQIRRLHGAKRATPTMGGLFVVGGLVAGVLAFGDMSNRYLQTALVVAIGLAAVGAIDDLTKLRGTANGISAKSKLLGQLAVAGVAAMLVYRDHAGLADGQRRVAVEPAAVLSTAVGRGATAGAVGPGGWAVKTNPQRVHWTGAPPGGISLSSSR